MKNTLKALILGSLILAQDTRADPPKSTPIPVANTAQAANAIAGRLNKVRAYIHDLMDRVNALENKPSAEDPRVRDLAQEFLQLRDNPLQTEDAEKAVIEVIKPLIDNDMNNVRDEFNKIEKEIAELRGQVQDEIRKINEERTEQVKNMRNNITTLTDRVNALEISAEDLIGKLDEQIEDTDDDGDNEVSNIKEKARRYFSPSTHPSALKKLVRSAFDGGYDPMKFDLSSVNEGDESQDESGVPIFNNRRFIKKAGANSIRQWGPKEEDDLKNVITDVQEDDDMDDVGEDEVVNVVPDDNGDPREQAKALIDAARAKGKHLTPLRGQLTALRDVLKRKGQDPVFESKLTNLLKAAVNEKWDKKEFMDKHPDYLNG